VTMKQRLRKLEVERAPHPAPVRYAWWDRSGPRPEAAPGEQLVVFCWEDSEPPLQAGGAAVPAGSTREGRSAEPLPGSRP
jgi:hypothetical protein